MKEYWAIIRISKRKLQDILNIKKTNCKALNVGIASFNNGYSMYINVNNNGSIQKTLCFNNKIIMSFAAKFDFEAYKYASIVYKNTKYVVKLIVEDFKEELKEITPIAKSDFQYLYCTCGNTELNQGFYKCDNYGYISKDEYTNLYCCGKCGKIYKII